MLIYEVKFMPYSQLLKGLIEKKRYSNKQVSKMCEKYGEPIAESYISKILKGEENIVPTEKKNEVLAKVLDVDVRLLNLEAFLDKCPEEIINFLNMARSSLFYVFTNIYNNSFTEEDFEKLSESLNEMPLADFLIKIDELKDEAKISKETDKLINRMENGSPKTIIMQLPALIGIPVDDDSMAPLIPAGSNVTLELHSDYENGEILCLQKKGEDRFFIRTCLFMKGNYLKGGKVILQPMNVQNYKIEEVNTNDIVILGKVKSIVTNIL